MIDIDNTNAQINNPADYKDLYAVSVRLYPNDEQYVIFSKIFGCCRVVQNDYISNKKEYDKDFYNILTLRASQKYNKPVEELTHEEIISVKEENEYFYTCDNAYDDYKIKKNTDEFKWLAEINSKIIQQAQRDIYTAFDNYYNNGSGYPKFKSKNDEQSCKFIIGALQTKNIKYFDETKQKYKYKQIPNCICGKMLSFGHKDLKNIPFRCSDRDVEVLNMNQENIHSITVSRTKNGECYASILIDDLEHRQLEKTNKQIGLDLGVKDLCIDSDGKRFQKLSEYNKSINDLEKKEKYLSKQMARLRKVYTEINKKNKDKPNFEPIDYKKCKRYNKVKKRHATVCKKIADIRENYLQNISYYYVSNYDVICIENLSVKNMAKNHKLARAIMSCGWGRLVNLLEEKCNRYKKTLIKINRFYPSSKTCNHCGHYKHDLTLKDREWVCTECGCIIDRDINAAKNILDEGLRCLNVYIQNSNII